MSEIREGQVLEIENIMSYRGVIRQSELKGIAADLEEKVNLAGAKRADYPITIIYGMGEDGMIEAAVLLPINRRIDDINGYVFKERIKIVNALTVRHKGNPVKLRETYNELNQYISRNNLVPITAGYNITRKIDMTDVNNTEIDIYVGISPNIL